jgi:hypothetical protein
VHAARDWEDGRFEGEEEERYEHGGVDEGEEEGW